MVPTTHDGSATMEDAPVVLECTGISKHFAGVRALTDVDFVVRRGEIHSLVGANGAGKSTLVKVLTGVYHPDAGSIAIDGTVVALTSPSVAADHGIAIVHQDSPLVPQFDVTRNVFLGREVGGRLGVLDFAAMRVATARALETIGATFSPDTLVRHLSVAQRELVAIAAALVQDPSVLILDEPTASLDPEDVDRLFAVIRALRDRGRTVIYISHHLDEVFQLASNVTVLRDGRRAGTAMVAETTKAEVIRLMIGRDLSQLFPKVEVPIGDVVMRVVGLQQGTAVRGVDFDVRRGEILGLAGLVGAGRTETALTLFGALPRSGGEVLVDGKVIAPSSPNAAKRRGLALIPEDRRAEGLIPTLSVRENLMLSSLGEVASGGLIRRAAERKRVARLIEMLDIRPPAPELPTRNLSGGNQQKVVIGRWVGTDAGIFLFDEPTTGVDVEAKVEIYRQMTELAQRGAAVVFISSEFEELIGMCDRIAVMSKGRVVHVFGRDEADEQMLLTWAASGDERESADSSDLPDVPAGQRPDPSADTSHGVGA